MSEELEQLIERAARALFEREFGDDWETWDEEAGFREFYATNARAALEAAGIPTLIQERDALREALEGQRTRIALAIDRIERGERGAAIMGLRAADEAIAAAAAPQTTPPVETPPEPVKLAPDSTWLDVITGSGDGAVPVRARLPFQHPRRESTE